MGKIKIDKAKALAIATSWLEERSNGFTFNLISTEKEDGEWSFVFANIMPEGHVLDGPTVVLVNWKTGELRTLG